MVARLEGELRIIELGPHGCGHRSIDEFFSGYRAVGVARPAMNPLCRHKISTWAAGHVDSDIIYSYERIATAGLASLARRLTPTGLQPSVSAAIRTAGNRSLKRKGERHQFCSTLIANAMKQACAACKPFLAWPTRAPIPLFQDPPDPCQLEHLTNTDFLADESVWTLTTPSDLWVAAAYEQRFFLTDDRTVELGPNTPVQHGACELVKRSKISVSPTREEVSMSFQPQPQQPQPQPIG